MQSLLAHLRGRFEDDEIRTARDRLVEGDLIVRRRRFFGQGFYPNAKVRISTKYDPVEWGLIANVANGRMRKAKS